MVYAPIWKDTFYSTTGETLIYKLITSGDTIFLGKAVKFPTASLVEVNINDICKNYMSNELPDIRGISAATSFTNTEACKTFQLYNENLRLLETYQFLWDWSYLDWNGGSKSMSLDINGHKDIRMYDFSTSVSAGVVTNSIAFTNNGYCGDWALYFQNKFGGWSSFLIEGNVKRTDTVTQYKYSKAARNTTIDFEDTVYSEDIDRRWQMYTGWLSDAESERLADNLLKSPRIYAHNLNTGEIIPVVITDTNIEHKTYRNQGHKPFSYVISVKASQMITRR